MEKTEYAERLKNLETIYQNREVKTVEELTRKFKKELEAEKAKRDPIRISLNWKSPKFLWGTIFGIMFLVASLAGNTWQFFNRREQKRTLQQMEHYSIVIRVVKTMGGIETNDVHRILRDLQYQDGDTTRLMHEVYRRIQEFESGEATIRRMQN